MQVEVKNMLLQFRVKNYRSIGDDVIIDMTATTNREHDDFLIDKNGVAILPVASIYGANASGKTNILDAMYEFRTWIASSHTFGVNIEKGSRLNKNAIVPFLFDVNYTEKESEFEVYITSEDGTKEYNYGFTIFKDIIQEEWLRERKLSRNETKWKDVFHRDGKNKIVICYDDKYEKLSTYNEFIEPRMLIISFLGNKNLGKITVFKEIVDWAKQSFFERPDIIKSSLESTLFFYHELKDSAFKETKEFIKLFDPCIEDIQIEKTINSQNEDVYKAYTFHRGKKFDLEDESDGTIKMFLLFLDIYLVFRLGGLLVVDELDARIHPLILRYIVQMFHSKEKNKKSGQLIFTTHNHLLLDKKEMRRDEIWFAEKS
ncbi:MAG TPA: hypothetical protein DDW34_03090 [Clostridium sp.]|nr:hypothetical protein [Clostridium sp.]